MDGSAKRIHKAALSTPEDHFLILLGHNGPTGASMLQYLKTYDPLHWCYEFCHVTYI